MTPDDMEARTPAPEGEVGAWRVKDYADGWILFHHEAPARASGEARNGALVQPLYASPVVPAPEGEVACVIAFREGRREPEFISWNKMPVGEHRLYASPVVPVGVSREEIARIVDPAAFLFGPGELEDKVYSSSRAHACDRADAILAALRPTDTGWRDIATAPKDGSDILILASGMAIEARYAPGAWGPDVPGEVQEYDGPVWVAFDDLTQFEIEESVLEGGQDHHGAVTHWMPLPAAPTDTGRE